MIELSIILINYNSLDYTVQCIKSILETQNNYAFEIILVDNASKVFDQSILPVSNKLKVIESRENLGFAKGNNLGIQHAAGEYILLLNNDTLVNEESILPVLKELKKDFGIGAITCQLQFPNGEIRHNCQSFPSKFKSQIEKLRLHKLFSKSFRSRYMQGFYFDYSKPGTPDWIWGTFFMFRKSLLEQLPNRKLNDDYFMYMEDAQWCLDISKIGKNISYFPNSHIIHFGGGSNAPRSDLMKETEEIFARNLKK